MSTVTATESLDWKGSHEKAVRVDGRHARHRTDRGRQLASLWRPSSRSGLDSSRGTNGNQGCRTEDRPHRDRNAQRRAPGDAGPFSANHVAWEADLLRQATLSEEE